MKEKLYTIPVNDAFSKDCECPVCAMYRTLETNAVDFIMGNSYMEDDIRMVTNKSGFCAVHMRLMYQNQNRLGLGLMLKTHMDQVIADLEKLTKEDKPSGSSFFKKKNTGRPAVDQYVHNLEHSCFVCQKINDTFDRYLVTILYLYRTEEAFRNTWKASKGLCTAHYGRLRSMAADELPGSLLETFYSDLDRLYLDNMKRVCGDLEWFTDKFDYRNADAPWKNSKDALPRSITKTNSIDDLL